MFSITQYSRVRTPFLQEVKEQTVKGDQQKPKERGYQLLHTFRWDVVQVIWSLETLK